jgi:DNA-binding Lrp family transcriptional regulator
MPPIRTLPFDIVLGLRLLNPPATMVTLAEELAVVPSQIHSSLKRLDRAGLLRPSGRDSNPRALGEFLLYGVRYAFPAMRGRIGIGVPTAHSAAPLAALVDATDVTVWLAADARAGIQGFSVAPLYRRAPELVERSPETYALLTIVDALRLGDRSVRVHARQLISEALGIPRATG